MRLSRSPLGAVAVVLPLTATCLLATFAHAAPPAASIRGILTKTSLTQADIADIRDYVDANITLLIAAAKADNRDDLKTARDQLAGPLGSRSASQEFRTAYIDALTSQFRRTQLDNEGKPHEELVRVNGMIVAAEMRAPQSVTVAAQVMNDPSPAVRLWAVRGVRQYVTDDQVRIPQRVQREVQQLLEPRVATEADDLVAVELVVALSNLDGPATGMIEGMNKRIALYAADPNRDMMPIIRGVTLESLELVAAIGAAADGQAPEAVRQRAKKLMAITMRAMKVATKHANLPAGAIDDVQRDLWVDQAKTCSYILGQWADALGVKEKPAALPPNPTGPQLQVNEWNWQKQLTKSPISIPEADLAVVFPPPKPNPQNAANGDGDGDGDGDAKDGDAEGEGGGNGS